jgi:cysteine desulfuration protein SufE
MPLKVDFKMTVNQIQDEIISEFSVLEGDRWMITEYLMELGRRLPKMTDHEKIEDNLIKGCMSKVYLTSNFNNGTVSFSADSNTETIKGLISLLIRVLNNKTPDEILNSNFYFFERLGLERFITSQRSGGFASMIKQMKLYALAYKTKKEMSS